MTDHILKIAVTDIEATLSTGVQYEDYDRYIVLPDGRVYSKYKGGRFRKPILTRHGYHLVFMYKDKIPKGFSVHRLVAKCFLPNPDNLPEVNHIDGDKNNNSVGNLEWCTSQHNVQHAVAAGLRKAARGTNNGSSKLNKEVVSTIMNMYREGVSQKRISEILDLGHTNVNKIVKGHTWSWFTGVVK